MRRPSDPKAETSEKKVPVLAGVVSAALLMTALGLGVEGCKKADQPQMSTVSDTGPDPAEANMAPVDASDAEAAATGQGLTPAPATYGTAPAYAPAQPYRGTTRYRAAGYQAAAPQGTGNESLQAAQAYAAGQQAPAPVERRVPEGYAQGDPQGGYDNGQGGAPYDDGQETSDDAQALSDQIYSDVDPNQQAQEPPPPLPVYEQPPAPADDYLWTPGYWGYAPAGYYWVPGAWCAAPYVGALWTPGWWGPYGRGYGFHHGYWGRHIGFYGGVPYGFGYYGTGYEGGYWHGNHFAYNRAVSNVNITNIHNVYNRTVIVNNVRINNAVTNRYVNNTVINNRVSYNGGRGGIQARPVRAELAAFHGQRTPPMSAQLQNQRAAETNRGQFFRQNQGRPQMATAGRVLTADPVSAPPVNNQPMRFGSGWRGAHRGVALPVVCRRVVLRAVWQVVSNGARLPAERAAEASNGADMIEAVLPAVVPAACRMAALLAVCPGAALLVAWSAVALLARCQMVVSPVDFRVAALLVAWSAVAWSAACPMAALLAVCPGAASSAGCRTVAWSRPATVGGRYPVRTGRSERASNVESNAGRKASGRSTSGSNRMHSGSSSKRRSARTRCSAGSSSVSGSNLLLGRACSNRNNSDSRNKCNSGRNKCNSGRNRCSSGSSKCNSGRNKCSSGNRRCSHGRGCRSSRRGRCSSSRSRNGRSRCDRSRKARHGRRRPVAVERGNNMAVVVNSMVGEAGVRSAWKRRAESLRRKLREAGSGLPLC